MMRSPGLWCSIPLAAKLGVPNVITFFGNRRGLNDEEATANCIAGLNKVKKIGDHGVRFASSCSIAR
jgi:hydroxypyruvate isomerase